MGAAFLHGSGETLVSCQRRLALDIRDVAEKNHYLATDYMFQGFAEFVIIKSLLLTQKRQ